MAEDPDPPQDGEATKKAVGMQSRAVQGVSLVSIGMGIGEVASFAGGGGGSGVVSAMKIASGAHGAAMGPVTVVEEQKLSQGDTFREALNAIRDQHGKLAGENDVLAGNIDMLQEDTNRMKECAGALKDIANQQSADLDRLNQLIAENKRIACEMRDIMKQKRLEEIVGIVLESDIDLNFKLSGKNEIEILLLKLKQYDDLDLDTENIKNSITKYKGDMRMVLRIIYRALPDQYKEPDDDECDDDDEISVQSSIVGSQPNEPDRQRQTSPTQRSPVVHPVVSVLASRKVDTIDFLEDNPATMTNGRRIALKLMEYKFYYPSTSGKDGKESSSEHDEFHNETSSISESEKLLDKPSANLKKAWAFFEHNTLPRFIYTPKPEDLKKKNVLKRALNKLSKADKTMDRAEPGEANMPTRLYSPVFTPLKQMGDFGIGVGLYFSTLRFLSILTLCAGIINSPVIAYFRSDEYSGGQPGLNSTFLKGSAICTRTEWVICESCDINATDNLISPKRLAQAVATNNMTGEEFSLTLGLRNDCDAATTTTGVVGFATLCFMVLGILVMDIFQQNMEIKFDEDEQTTQDYAIMISNPPPDAKDPKEWKDFFESHYDDVHVTCCTIGINNSELLDALVSRRELLQRIRFKLPVGSKLDLHSLEEKALEIKNNRSTFQQLLSKVSPGIPEWVDKITSLESTIIELSQKEYNATSVFIIFETESAQREVLASMSKNQYNFRDDYKISVDEAKEPSSVRWQYLDVRSQDKMKIIFITSFATLAGLILAATIIIIMKEKNMSAAPIAISLCNLAFPQFALFLTNYEKHASRDTLEVSLYIKIVVFRWVNTAIVTTIASVFTETLEPTGLIPGVLAIFIAEIITTNVFQLLDLGGNFKRHVVAPRAQSQEHMNNCMMGNEYYIAERYTNVTKILFLALWYSTLYPATYFLCAAALLINYFSDRFSLMRTWRQIGKIGSYISIVNRRVFCLLALLGFAINGGYIWASFPFDNLCKNTVTGGTVPLDGNIIVNNIVTKEQLKKKYFSPNATDFLKDDDGRIKSFTFNNPDPTYRVCDQNMIRYGNTFPALPSFQKDAWMNNDQEAIVYFFSITCLLLIGVILGAYLYHFIKKILGIDTDPDFVGEDQHINFSTLDSQSGYIPEARSLEIPYPLVACDLNAFDHDLFEWANPELPYSYYDLTEDVRVIFSGRKEKVDLKSIFSPIQHTPPK